MKDCIAFLHLASFLPSLARGENNLKFGYGRKPVGLPKPYDAIDKFRGVKNGP